ncbi:putative isomerase [Quercus suber]|uniref:Isomerase n=1 Tax=Quercus suber TaxID=58331 RepID=A0AAW0LJN9_QUESU
MGYRWIRTRVGRSVAVGSRGCSGKQRRSGLSGIALGRSWKTSLQCALCEDRESNLEILVVSFERDEQWLQAVAAEFETPMTCYLTRSTGSDSLDSPNPRYFTPFAEIELCGHATLAAAHALFSFGLLDSHIIEFVTPSNILTAKKFPETKASENGEAQECFLIELNFPTVPTINFSSEKFHQFPYSLVEIQPVFDAICKCPGMGIIVSGAAPSGSGFDFYSLFFCPKLGINEAPVCGNAHCALAPTGARNWGSVILLLSVIFTISIANS